MAEEKNMVKYETYKMMHENLTKAMKQEFYYQAIFIEYGILEDRLASVLKYAGIPYQDKRGRDISISMKLDKIRRNAKLQDSFYKQRFSDELIAELKTWLKARNELIHHLAILPYDHESIRITAEEGNELVKKVQSKSRSVINRLKKNSEAAAATGDTAKVDSSRKTKTMKKESEGS